MRLTLILMLALLLPGCEREEMEVEDTVFQHAIEYTDKAQGAEDSLMQGAEARRRAIEEQEQ